MMNLRRKRRPVRAGESGVDVRPTAPSRVPRGVHRLAMALVLVLVFGAGIGFDHLAFQGGSSAGAASSLTDLPAFKTFQQTWDLIHANYVDTKSIDDKALLYGASRGMVASLGDTGHSTFLDPAEAKSFQAQTQGELIGIGVEIDFSDGRPVIVAAIDGSPAAQAGIRAHDVIVKIGDASTDGLTRSAVSQLIRGNEGTQVTLTLQRPADSTNYTVTLTRSKITIKPVSWSMLPRHVAFIRLSEFTPGATDGIKAALQAVKDQGATSLVLDLRDNPGGLVSEAIGVASQFMPEGTTVYEAQDRTGEPRPVRTVGPGLGQDLPMVVIVNRGSASAAEIVAGSLRDNGRAELIGERTFGTGTVLMPYSLDDGSILLLGTGLWLTPKGQQIWHKGVAPDVAVALPPNADPLRPATDPLVTSAELAASTDAQLKKAFDDITHAKTVKPGG